MRIVLVFDFSFFLVLRYTWLVKAILISSDFERATEIHSFIHSFKLSTAFVHSVFSMSDHLVGEPRVQHFETDRQNETIDYNERFSWDNAGWLLGRAFFGPYGEFSGCTGNASLILS